MTTQATQSDLNWLQENAREWAQKVVDLHNTPVPEQYAAQKKSLLSYAKTIKETIEKIVGPIGALQPLNQLGIIPVVVGVVAVAGAIAAITKWTTDYYAFKEKINSYNALRGTGLTHGQALNVTESSTDGGSVFSNAAKLGKYALGGAALFFLAKHMRWV